MSRSKYAAGLIGAALLLAAPNGFVPSTAEAAPPKASTSSSADAPLSLPSAADLPPLPELPAIKPPEADSDSTKELESILGRLVSEKEDIRKAARKDVDEAKPSLVGAIHARIEELRGTIDRTTVPRILEDARNKARAKRKGGGDEPPPPKKPKKEKKKHKKDDSADPSAPSDKSDDSSEHKGADDGDWLNIVLADPKTGSDSWKTLVELLAMERMLAAAGTTEAVREMIALRAQFGELLRIDLARQIEDVLAEKAIPALIEARKHDASVVRDFAEKELHALKADLPGEAIASTDPVVVADVLRAFGRTRDVDAVHVVLSFANSDRRRLREAARQAIAGIGDAGKWQLREAFQDLTGEKPDKSASWDVLAKQIFAIYDKGRLADFSKLVTDGLAAEKAGKHDEAVAFFDKVLAQDPMFDQRKEMAPSYVAVALALPASDTQKKLQLLEKARRLDPEGKDSKSIESQIDLAEAKLLIDDHRPDRFLLERAIELDPSNQEAKDLLASFEEKATQQKKSNVGRYEAAAGVFAGMLVLVAAFGFLGRKPKAKKAKPAAATIKSATNAEPAASSGEPPARTDSVT